MSEDAKLVIWLVFVARLDCIPPLVFQISKLGYNSQNTSSFSPKSRHGCGVNRFQGLTNVEVHRKYKQRFTSLCRIQQFFGFLLDLLAAFAVHQTISRYWTIKHDPVLQNRMNKNWLIRPRTCEKERQIGNNRKRVARYHGIRFSFIITVGQ